jgi:nickel/cobalt transporter (NicO) family protein
MSIYTIVICTRGDKAQRLSGTKEGGGALFMRGVEFGAAGLVLLLGPACCSVISPPSA